MQVLAVGKCVSSAGRIVTDGNGWKPSSDAGKAGDPVQKYTFGGEMRINKMQIIAQFFLLPGLVFLRYSFFQRYSKTTF